MRLPFLSRARLAFPAARDFAFAELRGGDARVVIVPSLGGKIAELWLGGREWLWHSPVIPLTPGADGASYVETAESGGFDECFPTVGACRIPGWVRGAGGVELPDHGELWSRTPDVDVRTGPAGQSVTCSWTGLRLPYRFQRSVRIDARGVVHLEYGLANDGKERLPFLWSAHAMFPLSQDTRIVLPEGARLRVYAKHAIELGEARSEHRWPLVRGGGKAHDFTNPWEIARRYACKLYLDVSEGSACLREGAQELQFAWDALEIPNVGLWINKRGWTPFRDQDPCLNLALEPAIGAPDTIVEALGDWKSAVWIDPGDTRRWSLRLSGRRLPTDVESDATT
ncbi:MAG: hypothetical protein ACT4P7_18370 [Gemmatimonadaceae bacterium]